MNGLARKGRLCFKVHCKEKIEVTQAELLTVTVKEIPQFLVHLQTIHNQYVYSRNLKENMDGTTAVVNIDFSENYGSKYHTEVQSLHFGGFRKQLTLHTGVYYVLEDCDARTEIIKQDALLLFRF